MSRNDSSEPGQKQYSGRIFSNIVTSFLVISAYYVLRPVRDGLIAAAGEAFHYTFSATLLAVLCVVPLYWRLIDRFSVQKLMTGVYASSGLTVMLFAVVLTAHPGQPLLAHMFYIWLSVLTLVHVSGFWICMTMRYSTREAANIFGSILAAGSIGALIGPGLTGLSVSIHPVLPFGLSAAFLMLAACLLYFSEGGSAYAERPVFHSLREHMVLSRILHPGSLPQQLAVFSLLSTVLGSCFYYMQAHYFSLHYPETTDRIRALAHLDLVNGVLVVLLQFAAAPRLIRRFGTPALFIVMAAGLMLGFGALALSLSFPVFLAVHSLQRSGGLGLIKPAQELLFTVVSDNERKHGKIIADTIMFRSGDVLAGWLIALCAMQQRPEALAGFAAVAGAAAMGIGLHMSRTKAPALPDQQP